MNGFAISRTFKADILIKQSHKKNNTKNNNKDMLEEHIFLCWVLENATVTSQFRNSEALHFRIDSGRPFFFAAAVSPLTFLPSWSTGRRFFFQNGCHSHNLNQYL
jgi:hypothetical protein